MTLRANLAYSAGETGITLGKLPLATTLEAIVGSGITAMLDATYASTSGGIVTCNDLVAGIKVQSCGGTAPTINTAINSKPTVTHGSGIAGVLGQHVRALDPDKLDLGTGAWSFCALIRANGVGSSDFLTGYVPNAATSSTDRSPNFRFAAGGSANLIPALFANNLSTLRSFDNTIEFYNTNRLLCVTHTPTVGIKWFIDNWSSPVKSDTSTEAKEPFTDGRFIIGSVGAGQSTLNFAGSWAVMTLHKGKDLSLDDPARRDVMKAIAAYGGITST